MRRIQFKNLTILSSFFVLVASLLQVGMVARGQTADPAKKSDVLVYTNGDKLTGRLDHEADGTVFFKSDNAGTVKVPWDKIKSLETAPEFAVIEKGVVVGHKQATSKVPMGTIVIHGDMLTVNTLQGTQQIPVSNVAYLVDRATFEKNVLHGQSLRQGITGTIAAGVGLVYSTQNSRSISTAVALARGVPAVEWMPPRRRTLLNFASNYGQVTQPNTPTVKTNIVHGGLEEDEYLSPRFYLLQKAMFDHNYSQGLDLQQLYGAGAGYTAIKNPVQELDLTAIIDYVRQSFASSGSLSNVPPDYIPGYSTNLIGSSFGDTYVRNFHKNIVFNQVGSYNPAWNSPEDYSAQVAANVSFPIIKNFGFTVGFVDNYLNNPPPGFKGNSVQFNTGLSYTLP